MKEDMNLKNKFGTNNHFTVPEDYFEKLTSSVMERLPEVEEKDVPTIRLWDRVKPWMYMAAMFLGIFFMIRAVVGNNQPESNDNFTGNEQFTELPDEYIDPVIDQMMVDDYTLYVYLSDAEASIY